MIRGDNFWMLDEDETDKLELIGGTHGKQDNRDYRKQPIFGMGKDCQETSLP